MMLSNIAIFSPFIVKCKFLCFVQMFPSTISQRFTTFMFVTCCKKFIHSNSIIYIFGDQFVTDWGFSCGRFGVSQTRSHSYRLLRRYVLKPFTATCYWW